MNTRRDTTTPTLSVIDPRALAIRSVAYCRHPDKPDIDARITRQVFDNAGRQVASWDPRLWGVAPKPNLTTSYALSGQALFTDSVDAGWQVRLLNEAGSVCSDWDARGSQSHRQYDDLQRPLALTEQAHEGQSCVVERWTYGSATDDCAQHNQCGRPIRHDDPAGNRHFNDYGLGGAVLVESRRFLIELETPDWPLEPDRRDDYLEEKTYVTRQTFNPTGELHRHTDAMGNIRTQHYNVAGQSCATWLLQAGDGRQSKCLVSAIRYNAQGQIESETAGNGVIARAEYSRADGRLLRLLASVGTHPPLQDLNYGYDRVGNVISLEDKTQVVSWFNNQRIDPVSRYRYDSLYQLVEASGWEVSKPSHGPALPDLLPTPLDPNQRRNYTQKFDYDAAGNLITRHHSGAPGFSMYTSHHSNRSLAQRDDGSLPGEAEIALGFDAAGNQLELQRGQAMTWNVRNELTRVALVNRGNKTDDYECYRSSEPGHRLRKTHVIQASGKMRRAEVRYLPNLEVHRGADGREWHVISIETGRNQVRLLHWPDGDEIDQQCYSLGDHLGSSTLELDESAGLLSQEHFYPYGGTACWAGRDALTVKHKTTRYSGREFDATGLYYYGYRYYAPWLQRWICPDPAGKADGLNRYTMVGNNPVSFYDWQGTVKIPADVFISDIVNPMAKSIETGWFEELIWNNEAQSFASTGVVYGRGMEAYEGESSVWTPTAFGDAVALFRDQTGRLRLFANMYQQHMGIQPGMGLPEFAGILKIDPLNTAGFTIDNSSGHYKPEPSVGHEALVSEIAPAQSVRFVTVPESLGFGSALRMDSIDSPEQYSILVNRFKNDYRDLIGYLKEHGVWEAAKALWENSKALGLIFEMDATGLSAQEIYMKRSVLAAEPVSAPMSSSLTVSNPEPSTQPKTSKSSFFQRLFSR